MMNFHSSDGEVIAPGSRQPITRRSVRIHTISCTCDSPMPTIAIGSSPFAPDVISIGDGDLSDGVDIMTGLLPRDAVFEDPVMMDGEESRKWNEDPDIAKVTKRHDAFHHHCTCMACRDITNIPNYLLNRFRRCTIPLYPHDYRGSSG